MITNTTIDMVNAVGRCTTLAPGHPVIHRDSAFSPIGCGRWLVQKSREHSEPFSEMLPPLPSYPLFDEESNSRGDRKLIHYVMYNYCTSSKLAHEEITQQRAEAVRKKVLRLDNSNQRSRKQVREIFHHAVTAVANTRRPRRENTTFEATAPS